MGGVEIHHEPPENLAALVAALDNPWIADEGPLDAWFRRGRVASGGQGGRALLPRGLAFDADTTVTWDEDEIQVVRRSDDQKGEDEPDLIVLRSDVLVREGFDISQVFQRLDYLRDGVLVASRYLPKRSP
jgi:hypothetical protein